MSIPGGSALGAGVRERVVPGVGTGEDALHQLRPADGGQDARLRRDLHRRSAIAEAALVEPIGERIEHFRLHVADLCHARTRVGDHVFDVQFGNRAQGGDRGRKDGGEQGGRGTADQHGA